MSGDESLCMHYYRNGTCSKGASCERMHGIYCKVSAHSLLALAGSTASALTAKAWLLRCNRLFKFLLRGVLAQDALRS